MPEHYTKNTEECTAFCKKCGRMTQHRVFDGRRGPCIDPDYPVQELTKAQQKRRNQQEKEKQQPDLFRRNHTSSDVL